MSRISTRALMVLTGICLGLALLTCVVLWLFSQDQPMSYVSVISG
ncbi:hypothetical protein ACF3NT_01645 [Naumannella halotolerans]|uniref:Uncharacterized protein n=1 Tax=Naumannella halotolerans TaxID=993414 RepID=A0A4R7J6E1_9ACTN|nr:hypothetical protein [Naumannella halotolerans]TDT32765.1 hypothetical protein CLV29_0353 [Naumannella halotolerans]